MPSTLPSTHQNLITQRLPSWASRLSEEQWQILRASTLPLQGLPGQHADGFENALPELREAVLASQAQLATAQQRLARTLKGLQQIDEFAEPLLAARLKAEHGFQAPLRTSELIHVHDRFTHGVYVSTYERRTLLEAALHNFSDDISFNIKSALALKGDTEISDITVTGSATLGDSETRVPYALDSKAFRIKALSLSPKAFASTCRDLDLGQRYQEHLEARFSPPEVRLAATRLYQSNLQLAADLARLQHRISGKARDCIQRLLDDGSALPCQQLQLFGVTLHEALVIDAGEAGRLLYLPGQEAAFRAFDSDLALAEQLQADLRAPAFRKQCLALIASDERLLFLDRARQNLSTDAQAGYDHPWTLPKGAGLHLEFLDIAGSLFDFLYSDHFTRLKAEAQLFAIPTAQADEQARKRRLAMWKSLGLNALMTVSMFIPAVGVLMIAVTACQLLYEVYEGYEAWDVGDRDEALQHLEVVGLNLAVIAGLHVGGQVVRTLARTPLLESLDPITRADGSQRLWRPDLTPYRVEAAEATEAAEQTEHTWRMDNHWYRRRFDQQLKRWRLVHPDDPDAYQPLLEHNGEGAWRAEHEQPRDWPLARQVKRLDSRLETFPPAELEHAARISGVNEAQLRQVHLTNALPPPLLADTLARLRVQRLVAADYPVASRSELDRLFAEAYEASEPAHADEARMIQDYPSLGAPLCRRLLRSMTTTEQAAWNTQQPLPGRLVEAARRLEAELPLARGLEGLYFPGLASVHSERLVLQAMSALKGWPPEVRIEVRADAPRGPTLAIAGSRSATSLRIIIKSARGYEPYLGERPASGVLDYDLCQAALKVLSVSERAAMGLEASGNTLQARLANLVDADRQAWAQRVRPFGDFTWSRRSWLHGGTPLDRAPAGEPEPAAEPQPQAVPIDRALYRQVQAVYPNLTDEGVEALFTAASAQGLNPLQAAMALGAQYRTLVARLSAWAADSPARTQAMSRLLASWRGMSHELMEETQRFLLDLSEINLTDADLASLDLPDHFPHIQILDLTRNPEITTLPATLLERLPDLHGLYLTDCALEQLPQVSAPRALRVLDLENNHLTWNDQAQQVLDQMVNLRSLDLSNNPLQACPDITALPELHSLLLGNCELQDMPAGLVNMRNPRLLNLSDNHFTELPQPQPLPQQLAQVMRLESEHMGEAMAAQINAYYVRFGIDLMVANHEYENLLSVASDEDFIVWSRLPLQYRRDLRALIGDQQLNEQGVANLEEIWRRLHLIDEDEVLGEQAIAMGAAHLLEMPFPPAPELDLAPEPSPPPRLPEE
ncbi:dermonecrotic toxin domain-containing protein [Pseudomonas putida]|uniref:dermonecrotic toxin domain-containing protein n=1 Tax=Pseudomonas putida TaxID=303 RepID=UPI00383B2DD5